MSKNHIFVGAGIFDVVPGFFKRIASSSAVRSLASSAARAAATDIGKSAISSAKTVGKELATSAISTAKDLAIAKGKQLIDRASSRVLTPKNAELIKTITGLEPNTPVLTQKSKDVLTSIVNTGASEATRNINNLMMGHGISSSNAIRIQDLVRQNGSGLRLA